MNSYFADPPHNICSSTQFQCSDSSCIDSTKVCNIIKDCENGEDEEQECGKGKIINTVIIFNNKWRVYTKTIPGKIRKFVNKQKSQ